MYAYLLYSCFIYRHVQALFLNRYTSYIFPMLWIANLSTRVRTVHWLGRKSVESDRAESSVRSGSTTFVTSLRVFWPLLLFSDDHFTQSAKR